MIAKNMHCVLLITTLGIVALAQVQDGRPSTVSRVKTRQKFALEEMQRDLFTVTPVVQKDDVTVRQLTEKEMPVLSTMLPLEQVQLRLIDMQPCSANVPMVAPRHAIFNFGLGGTTSVGVVQNRQGKVLNTVQKEQSTFFPQGMVFFEANLDCQPSRVLQALSSVQAKDIFPESQLVETTTAAIADQFKVSAQEAATLKSAAQANANSNPLDGLLTQCRQKCASNGGIQTQEQGGTSSNLQKFGGALGGIQAPAVTQSGERFQVEGNALLNTKSAALQRSCDVQKNKCADAANAGGNRNGLTVSACEQQHGECLAFQRTQSV